MARDAQEDVHLVCVSYYDGRVYDHYREYSSMEEAIDDVDRWIEQPNHSVRIARKRKRT